jgi:hypothetical protein
MWTLALLATLSTADAGKLYINDVRADSLRNTELKDVTVKIDGDGDIYVVAPHYNIQVVGGDAPAADAGDSAAKKAVPQGVWWLVTEDNRSSGHSIDVYVGTNKIKTIRSGEPQVILDLAPYLFAGDNEVSFASKGGAVGGGVLNVYVGRASNKGGTLSMETPQISYARRSTDGAESLDRFVLKAE